MRCPQCGKELGDVSTAQCPNCGLRFTDGGLPSAAESRPETTAASVPADVAPYRPTSPVALLAQFTGKRRIAVIVTLAVIAVLLIGGGSVAAIVAAARPAGQIAAAPTAGATKTPTPMATQTSYLIYQNALTKRAAKWVVDTHCKFESDGFHVLDAYICFAPTGQLVDVDVSVDVKQVGGSTNQAYGIAFRYPRPPAGGSANHYEFGIDSDGQWDVWKVVDDEGVNLAGFKTNLAIHSGRMATNRLRVRTNGEQFDFFVNGTYVGHVDDSRYINGYVGTIGYVGLRGCEDGDVVFTNISVSQV